MRLQDSFATKNKMSFYGESFDRRAPWVPKWKTFDFPGNDEMIQCLDASPHKFVMSGNCNFFRSRVSYNDSPMKVYSIFCQITHISYLSLFCHVMYHTLRSTFILAPPSSIRNHHESTVTKNNQLFRISCSAGHLWLWPILREIHQCLAGVFLSQKNGTFTMASKDSGTKKGHLLVSFLWDASFE